MFFSFFMPMPRLAVEDSEEYKRLSFEIKILQQLKAYYESGKNFYDFELKDGVQLRDVIAFMADFGFPRSSSAPNIPQTIKKIEEMIEERQDKLSSMRFSEIKSRALDSLLIIPSWNRLLKRKFNGFYLNKPVIDLKRDTIVMLTAGTAQVADFYGDPLAIITGPGIFYTEFSIEPRKYLTNVREINMVVMPKEHFDRLISAPSIVQGNIDATVNELMCMMPFHIIETPYSVQALTRGVVSRNVFHPNKPALDALWRTCKDPTSYHPSRRFSVLSAHPHFYNRLLLSHPRGSQGGSEDISYHFASAGIAAILDNADRLVAEIMSEEQQNELLKKFVKVKEEYASFGHELLMSWAP